MSKHGSRDQIGGADDPEMLVQNGLSKGYLDLSVCGFESGAIG